MQLLLSAWPLKDCPKAVASPSRLIGCGFTCVKVGPLHSIIEPQVSISWCFHHKVNQHQIHRSPHTQLSAHSMGGHNLT